MRLPWQHALVGLLLPAETQRWIERDDRFAMMRYRLPHTVPVSSTGTRQEELLEFDMVTLGHDGDFEMHIKQWACYGYGDDRDGSMSPLGGGE